MAEVLNKLNPATGKYESINGGAFQSASTPTPQVQKPVVNTSNPVKTAPAIKKQGTVGTGPNGEKIYKSDAGVTSQMMDTQQPVVTPKLPAGMTQQQYDTYYAKQSAADQQKLSQAGYTVATMPQQPVADTQITPVKTTAGKAGTAPGVKLATPTELKTKTPDYQDISAARQSETINNLEAYYAKNPNMFSNADEFRKTFDVGTGARAAQQDQRINNRYAGKKEAIQANNDIQTKLNSLNTLNGSDLANIPSTDATFLMNNNPTKYNEYLTAKKTKDSLDTINGVTTTTTVDTTDNNFITNMMKQLGAGTTVNFAEKRNETKLSNGLTEKATELNTKKQAYDDLMTAYNNVQKAVDKRYEGTGADRGYLTALAQKEQYDMQDAVNNAKSAYELATNNYNSALSTAQQDFTVMQAQVAQDNQAFNQKLQGLGFAYDLFKDTPKFQMQQAQIKYNIDNPDMDSTNPATQKQALNQALAGYYKDYGMIIQRPQAQVVNDVMAYAKSKGISVSQALKENFITPLQGKSEYKTMTNKALGIETPSWSVSVDKDGNKTVTYQGQGAMPAGLVNTNNTSGVVTPTGKVETTKIGNTTVKFDSVAMTPFQQAVNQMTLSGQDPIIGSTYRSYDQQKQLYDAYKAGTGGLAAAPGTSKHESGLAIDLYGGKDPKTGKLLPPTEQQKNIMEANGFKWMGLAGDSGHFEYQGVNKGGATTTEVDTSSKEILGQTGLSIDAFSYLTQGNSALTKLSESTRSKIKKEAESFLASKGIDISSFQSSYKALNESLQRTIKIQSNVQRDEVEIQGTLDNLVETADKNKFGKIKAVNLGKMFAGEQFNDPNLVEYQFQLLQLQEEIAGYNAALRGDTSPVEADSKRAASVIMSGISSGGLAGLKSAMEKSVLKMSKNLPKSVESINKQIRSLFGVGGNYKPTESSKVVTPTAPVNNYNYASGAGTVNNTVTSRINNLY